VAGPVWGSRQEGWDRFGPADDGSPLELIDGLEVRDPGPGQVLVEIMASVKKTTRGSPKHRGAPPPTERVGEIDAGRPQPEAPTR
jgi:hypothetical protein